MINISHHNMQARIDNLWVLLSGRLKIFNRLSRMTSVSTSKRYSHWSSNLNKFFSIYIMLFKSSSIFDKSSSKWSQPSTNMIQKLNQTIQFLVSFIIVEQIDFVIDQQNRKQKNHLLPTIININNNSGSSMWWKCNNNCLTLDCALYGKPLKGPKTCCWLSST